VVIAFGETCEALAADVQVAPWALGGVRAVLRSDNLWASSRGIEAQRCDR
jgi:hypothetical protein